MDCRRSGTLNPSGSSPSPADGPRAPKKYPTMYWHGEGEMCDLCYANGYQSPKAKSRLPNAESG